MASEASGPVLPMQSLRSQVALETYYSGLLFPDNFRVSSGTRVGMLTCQVGALPPPPQSPVPVPMAEDTDLWGIY